MKFFWYCGFLLVALFYKVDAKRFRCDYTYFKDAEGYLKYQEIPVSWHEARLRCSLEGTTLASPVSPSIQNAMKILLNVSACDRGVWTGIHSTFSEGDYTTVDGIPLSEIPHKWMKCEPDNHLDQEGCILQLPNGELADANCNETLPYFCFKKTYPGMIMNSCGSVDNDYTMDKRSGKCYKFHKIGRTWKRAFMACQAEGGHLAIINNDAEAQVLKDLFGKYPAGGLANDIYRDGAFLGFRLWAESGEWRTIHGQTLEEAGYEKWGKNEPNNPTSQFCGAMFRSGLFDDATCDRKTPFVCEKDPESLMCGHERKK